MHIQAVSVSVCDVWFDQFGVFHESGQPDQPDAHDPGWRHPARRRRPSTMTPSGSPGRTSWSGPTVDGGTASGSFAFGTTPSSLGRAWSEAAKVHQ